jgi:UDP-N-acetylglucosamine 2-epimerase
VTEFDRNSTASPMTLSARKHDILTITLTHGVILEYGIVPILSDYIFCWGEAQKRQLIKLGASSDCISVTGNPMIKRFNKFSEQNIDTRKALKVCLAISPESDIVNNSLIEPFISAVEQNNNIQGIIKLHPSLKKENYKWVNSISTKVNIFESSDLANNELFKLIDLLIIHFSGIANEALAAGTPVIIMEPNGDSNLNVLQKELTQKAGCKIVTNGKELIEILDEVLVNPNLFRTDSINKCKEYLDNLFEFIGDESVRVMISEIDRLSGESGSK